ncbi:MAG TPA: alpha/beta hydrolase [Polyangiales bacterium]|nr:alpha/beta hydrolase [Polyangiales bacterium]
MRAETGVPAHARLIDVEGVKLAYVREGEGPPLVCLHATGHGGADFAALAGQLAREYEVIRVDWPGQGRSPDSIAPSAERYGALLIALLDQLGIERPTLLGNSIGGGAAIHYALARPVRALILCDSAGLVRVDAFTRAVCALFVRFFNAGARGARWFAPLFALYYRRLVLPRAAAHVQRERIIAAAYELAPVIRDAWRSFASPEADLRARLPALAVPVWVAWARDDRVIPLALCKRAIDAIPNVTLSVFDAGHAAFLEAPEAFLEGFRAFMAGVSRAPSAESSRRASA